jgi:sulfur-oxidizing protein SoxZ
VARALINVPKTARAGEVIEIKTLIAHPMETGYRTGPEGRMLPRDIIRRFTCTYDGEVVFSAELHPAVAANPFVAFTTTATVTGPLTFTWEGDNGFSQTETATLTVVA